MLVFFLLGLISGGIAKNITPDQENEGWLSSLALGVVGSFFGGYIARWAGITMEGTLPDILAAIAGSWLVLYIYYKFFSQSINDDI